MAAHWPPESRRSTPSNVREHESAGTWHPWAEWSEQWARARLRLVVLRGFEVWLEGRTVALSAGAQRVLALLALNDRPMARPLLAGVLWPDASDKRASGSLRSAMWDLRLVKQDLIEGSGNWLRLNPDVLVDFRLAANLAEPILNERRPCPDSFAERELLGNDLLSDWYDDWVVIERERFHQRRLHLLESLCERLVRERVFGRAIEVALGAVAADPLRESAHRALIRAHLAEGNASEALRQYAAYVALLRDELDLEPSADLRALVPVRPGRNSADQSVARASVTPE